MKSRQSHTLIVERRVLRADGRPRPGDHNQVVAFWSEDDDAERAVRGAGGGQLMLDRTGITPLAACVRDAQVSDEYLEMTERQRWERERGR